MAKRSSGSSSANSARADIDLRDGTFRVANEADIAAPEMRAIGIYCEGKFEECWNGVVPRHDRGRGSERLCMQPRSRVDHDDLASEASVSHQNVRFGKTARWDADWKPEAPLYRKNRQKSNPKMPVERSPTRFSPVLNL